MSEADDSLALGRLAALVKHTLLMMLGRRPIGSGFILAPAGVWQAVWTSVIFTLIVSVYPGLRVGVSVLLANLILQLVAVVLMVLLFAAILRGGGLSDRIFAFVVPFLWVENVQHLFGGLVQNLVILTGDATLLILITPLIFWTVYWLWRIGRDQLGRGGWFATGLLFLSFVIDAGLFLFVQSRVHIRSDRQPRSDTDLPAAPLARRPRGRVLQRRGDVVGCPFAGTDQRQRADDVPNLVMQERPRRGMKMQFLADSLDAKLVKRPHRAVGLALAGAETGEIMPSDKPVRCFLHQARFQRGAVMPDRPWSRPGCRRARMR